MKELSARVLTVETTPRRLVYQALLAAPGRDWTVAHLAQQVPQAPVETVRTTLNMLLGERLMDLVPRQRAMTVRLTTEGHTTVQEILDQWTTTRS